MVRGRVCRTCGWGTENGGRCDGQIRDHLRAHPDHEMLDGVHCVQRIQRYLCVWIKGDEAELPAEPEVEERTYADVLEGFGFLSVTRMSWCPECRVAITHSVPGLKNHLRRFHVGCTGACRPAIRTHLERVSDGVEYPPWQRVNRAQPPVDVVPVQRGYVCHTCGFTVVAKDAKHLTAHLKANPTHRAMLPAVAVQRLNGQLVMWVDAPVPEVVRPARPVLSNLRVDTRHGVAVCVPCQAVIRLTVSAVHQHQLNYHPNPLIDMKEAAEIFVASTYGAEQPDFGYAPWPRRPLAGLAQQSLREGLACANCGWGCPMRSKEQLIKAWSHHRRRHPGHKLFRGMVMLQVMQRTHRGSAHKSLWVKRRLPAVPNAGRRPDGPHRRSFLAEQRAAEREAREVHFLREDVNEYGQRVFDDEDELRRLEEATDEMGVVDVDKC